MQKRHWAAIIALGVYVLTIGYVLLWTFVPVPAVRQFVILLPTSTLAFFAFALFHAGATLGWRRAGLFVAITIGVSLLFESVGVQTGWVYGPYTYTGRLGPKLLGLVPVYIPLAWFMMGYCAHSIVDRLAQCLPLPRRWTGDVWVAGTAAVAMTAWDLTMDPLMVAGGHWQWLVEGAYFGIPMQNFFGWLITAFTFFFLYRRSARRVRDPWPASPGRWWAALPWVAYTIAGGINLITTTARGMGGAAVAGFFGMAPFVLVGWVLWRYGAGAQEEGSTTGESTSSRSEGVASPPDVGSHSSTR